MKITKFGIFQMTAMGLALAATVPSAFKITGDRSHCDSGVVCDSHSPKEAARKTETYKQAFAKYSSGFKKNQPASLPEQKLLGKVMVCFAPGTDDAIVTAFNDAMQAHVDAMGLDYQTGTRWSGTNGTPRALTWSLVPDGQDLILGSFTGAGEADTPSDLFAQWDTKFAAQGGRAHWINRLAQCFARWQQLTGLSYTRVTFGGNDWDDGAAFGSSAGAAGLRGDIRIGGHNIDGVNGILAYNYFPSTGDMVLDTGESGNFTSTTNFNRSYRNIVMHEHGHGMGFNHMESNNTGQLMEPFLATTFDGPQQDDIRGSQFYYGDDYENNGSFGTASDLGARAAGTHNFGDVPVDAVGVTVPVPANSAICSMHGNGDQDWYKFTTSGPLSIVAQVNPIGTTYNQGAQGSGGTTPLNALAIVGLDIAVYDTNGTTQLGTASAVAGTSATTASINLPSAGTYFVRVTENGTPTQSQLYKFNFTLSASANQPPVLAAIGNKNVNELSNLAFSISATDPNAGQTITYTMTGAPSGATLNPSTGAFSWTPSEAQGPGTYNVTFIATDNGSPTQNDSETIAINVAEVNAAPTLIWGTPNNTVVTEGSTLTFDADATDPDLPANTLTFSLPTAPAGATINPTTGVFSWTPSAAQANNIWTLTVRVSDGAGGIADRTINLITQYSTKTFTGSVNLDFWPLALAPSRPLNWEVRNVGNLTAIASGTTFANAGGAFSFTANSFAAGSYDVWIKSPYHLADLKFNMTVTASGVALGNYLLLSGDCNTNNYINTDDYLIFSLAFDTGLGDPGYDAAADANGDNFINTDDYLAISQNFDTGGDD